MFKWLVLLSFTLALVGCRAEASNETVRNAAFLLDETTQTPDIQNIDDTEITFTVDGIELTVQRPPEWEYYATEYGLVLAEHISSVATDGQLNGLLAHIFVPPLDDFAQPAGLSDMNYALHILNEIIVRPEYIGSATVSTPVGFEWADHDAAYYLIDNGDENLTIVIGVYAEAQNRLVASSISAPKTQTDRIRAYVPELLDGIIINDTILNSDSLDVLPDPLTFPDDLPEDDA